MLAISGPNVLAGYVDPRQDAGVRIEIAGERGLNTGDLARQDRDGYCRMTERKKDLIIRGGHNIDPKVIKEALQPHPAVRLSAAVGRPDAHAGELPVAHVQLAAGASALEDELLRHVAKRIPERVAHPKAVRFLPAHPMTPVGKLFEPALIMREIEDVVRGEAVKAGVIIEALEVSQDPARGIIARVTAVDADGRLRETLGRDTLQFDLI